MRSILGLIVSSAALVLAPALHAQTLVYSDNYNSDTLGAVPTGAAGSAIVVQDTGNLFGQGTSNQILQFSSAASETGYNNYPGTAGIVSLTFSMYMPSGQSSADLYTTLRENSGFTSPVAVPVMNNGVNSTGGPLSGLFQLTLVGNTTGSAITYTGAQSANNVAADSFDVWINGTRIIQGGGLSTAPATLDYFSLDFLGSGTDYLDNLAVYSTATVGVLPAAAAPEPTTWAMLLGGIGLLLAFFHRKIQLT